MVNHWIIWRVLAASETESHPISRFSKALHCHPPMPAVAVIRGHLMLQNYSLNPFLTRLIHMIQIIY